jgi:hypothetical protein
VEKTTARLSVSDCKPPRCRRFHSGKKVACGKVKGTWSAERERERENSLSAAAVAASGCVEQIAMYVV